MPMARSRSIWSSPEAPAAMPEAEAEAEVPGLLLPREILRDAEPVLLPPREPEVVAALGLEASARRLQPRFARCCKRRRRRSRVRAILSVVTPHAAPALGRGAK